MDLKPDLKPCPICASKAPFVRSKWINVVNCNDSVETRAEMFRVECSLCPVKTNYFASEAQAHSVWNGRPLEQAIDEALQQQRSINTNLFAENNMLRQTMQLAEAKLLKIISNLSLGKCDD